MDREGHWVSKDFYLEKINKLVILSLPKESSACLESIAIFLASLASAKACDVIQTVSADPCDVFIASRYLEYTGDLFH